MSCITSHRVRDLWVGLWLFEENTPACCLIWFIPLIKMAYRGVWPDQVSMNKPCKNLEGEYVHIYMWLSVDFVKYDATPTSCDNRMYVYESMLTCVRGMCGFAAVMWGLRSL